MDRFDAGIGVAKTRCAWTMITTIQNESVDNNAAVVLRSVRS